jgi:hypothetical protein
MSNTDDNHLNREWRNPDPEPRLRGDLLIKQILIAYFPFWLTRVLINVEE